MRGIQHAHDFNSRARKARTPIHANTMTASVVVPQGPQPPPSKAPQRRIVTSHAWVVIATLPVSLGDLGDSVCNADKYKNIM